MEVEEAEEAEDRMNCVAVLEDVVDEGQVFQKGNASSQAVYDLVIFVLVVEVAGSNLDLARTDCILAPLRRPKAVVVS